MAWYIRNVLCDDEKYRPGFYFDGKPAPEAFSAPIWEGRRVDPVPELIARRRGEDDFATGPIPDFLTFSGKHVVADGFRRIVEELEPGQHQFIPVTLIDRNDLPVERPYWVVNALTLKDVILSSARVAELRAAGRAPSREELTEMPGSSFEIAERSAIGGCHLWRATRKHDPDLYFSDQLIRRIRNARLRKLTAKHIFEV